MYVLHTNTHTLTYIKLEDRQTDRYTKIEDTQTEGWMDGRTNRQTKGIGSLGAGVTAGCELSDMAVMNVGN